jgi:Zn-finger protein
MSTLHMVCTHRRQIDGHGGSAGALSSHKWYRSFVGRGVWSGKEVRTTVPNEGAALIINISISVPDTGIDQSNEEFMSTRTCAHVWSARSCNLLFEQAMHLQFCSNYLTIMSVCWISTGAC